MYDFELFYSYLKDIYINNDVFNNNYYVCTYE